MYIQSRGCQLAAKHTCSCTSSVGFILVQVILGCLAFPVHAHSFMPVELKGLYQAHQLAVELNGERHVVELLGVDTPHYSRSVFAPEQPYARSVFRWVRDLFHSQPGRCHVEVKGVDPVAEESHVDQVILWCHYPGRHDALTNMNEHLIKYGMGWAKPGAPADWARLEAAARGKGVGLWAEPEPVAPWLYRDRQGVVSSFGRQ